MHVLFVEPAFPRNQREFVRALASVGARVTGIGERPVEYLDGELKSWLYRYEQVPSVVHEQSLLDTVRRVQKRERVDRLEATIEAHIMPTARVREACGIPGTSVQTSYLCRDKPAMKQALRDAGVPTAMSDGVDTAEQVRAFIDKVGYPVIIKPRDAAGAAGTYRIDKADQIDDVVRESGIDRGISAAIEEFVEGHEGFYDTITLNGEVLYDFVTHYYPNVLEAMRTRWISPVFIATNRVDTAGYDEVKAMGRKVIESLEIGTSATHQEWFFGPKGLKFSEIGCRPPGVGAWDLYCAGNDFDIYRAWAAAIVHGRRTEHPNRRYAAGLINLRPEQDGHITGYSGVDEMFARWKDWIIDSHFPAPGTPTQPVEAGYMANAYVRIRYPDYDDLREILQSVGRSVKVHAH